MICDLSLWAPTPNNPTAPEFCWAASLDIAARASVAAPDLGISRTFSLPRAQAEATLGRQGSLYGRFGVGFVRSGADDGYIGVDGESLVPTARVAEVRVEHSRWGLAGGAGLIESAWVRSGDEASGLRAWAPGFTEDAGWTEVSDLGAWMGVTVPNRWVSARVELTTGEGGRMRERNEGKNLEGVVTVRPLQAEAGFVEVSLWGREGSRGLGSARDHRLGGRLWGGIGPLRLGVEGGAAFGVGGDAERAPVGLSGWLNLGPWNRLNGWARIDTVSEDVGNPDATRLTVHAGVGVGLGPESPVSLGIGYCGVRAGSAVNSLAGTDTDSADLGFLQLGLSL